MAASERGTVQALQRWAELGLLTPAQVQAILKHEGWTGLTVGDRTPSPWALTVSLLGALVLGLGVIALVGANWAEIPGWAKLLGVLGLMLGAYAGGYRLRDAPARAGRHLPGVGAALYLLGGVLYGALLALLAQGLQLGVSTDTLQLLWGLGLAALAYAVRLPPALHLALPVAVVLPLGGLFGWSVLWRLSPLAASGVIAGLGALMFGVSALHGRDPARARHDLSHPWAFWAPPLLLSGIYALHLQTRGGWGDGEGDAASWLWLALVFLLALGVTWLGGRGGRRAWINWGLLFVGITVLTVYFTLLGTLAYTGSALIGAGGLLLALGYGLERTRRRLSAEVAPGGSP
ncbi:Predicted membrane protein [Deinococcus reticulitermitis]|uniref:Predicted membrane protein n=1 Tax=Deinococcus reticulitermitis TaxID=856736 RepID=A0A1H7A2N6_9DEIO|nr:DUF2157 domain-containing protein [Deinococcus reticulitermitis]SEJ59949.1 Predicted membrane protein [Deinococcus reticulitermitis]